MCIKNLFKIFLCIILLVLITGCMDRERLNPMDPLSSYYEEPRWFTNIYFFLDYQNLNIIDEDTTWSMPTMKLIQNVLITKRATLTIQVGTEVEFIGVGIGSPIGIIVDDGRLNAVGTGSTAVTFTAVDFTAAYVVFRSNSIDYNSILQYCDLRSVHVYCIHQNPPKRINIIIRNNKIIDLLLWRFPAIEIRNNDIETLDCTSTPAVIKHNLFFSSKKEGIVIQGVSQPVISSNNLLSGFNYRIKNKTPLAQSAIDNYWGSGFTTASNIEVYIWDDSDDVAIGPINFQPFFTNQVSGAGAQVSW